MKNNLPFLLWITGLTGSGKTTLGKKIFEKIKANYPNTIFINGDDIRNIFSLEAYDIKSRLRITYKYHKLIIFLLSQNFNVIFATVSMFNKIRLLNKKKIKNYFEVYIKSDIKFLQSLNKKDVYNDNKLIWGIDIKPQFPRNSDYIINNNIHDIDLNTYSDDIIHKLKRKFYK